MTAETLQTCCTGSQWEWLNNRLSESRIWNSWHRVSIFRVVVVRECITATWREARRVICPGTPAPVTPCFGRPPPSRAPDQRCLRADVLTSATWRCSLVDKNFPVVSHSGIEKRLAERGSEFLLRDLLRATLPVRSVIAARSEQAVTREQPALFRWCEPPWELLFSGRARTPLSGSTHIEGKPNHAQYCA